MGLDTTVRRAVATVNKITNTLQVAVQHQPWIGDDGAGTDEYGTVIERRAVVNEKQRQVYSDQKLVNTKATITFLVPFAAVTPNAGKERMNPVDPRDIFTLPDGLTGPTILADGLLDGGTGRPYFSEVYLGL